MPRPTRASWPTRAGDRRLPQVPRDRAARAAALRGDAPHRRPGDGRGRQQERRAAASAPDYKAAIARYQDYLKDLPERPGQRPRAVPARPCPRARRRAGSGAQDARPAGRRLPEDAASATRPSSAAASCCSTTSQYAKAEQAFATVMQGDAELPYHDRALYMHGWSLFKQARLEDALRSFFAVLDLKIAGSDGDGARDPRRPDARRPRAGRRHLPRHQRQPGEPAGRRVDPALHRQRRRGAPTSSASTSSSASSTSSRTGPRTPPTPSAPSPGRSRCMRRRRCCRRA